MEGFSTFGEAMELFRRVNCIGNQNCIFIGYKDFAKNAYATGAVAGLTGVLGGMIAGSSMNYADQMSNNLYNYGGYLVNET